MKIPSPIRAAPLLFLLLFPSCEEDVVDSSKGPIRDGVYRYAAYNEHGALAVSGWLGIEFDDAERLHGEWHFGIVGDASRMGPQTGDGILVGTVQEGRISINLNPQYVDNNVFLFGVTEGSAFKGNWTWISFVGLTSQGAFEATRW
jgi:hypothetical protein